MKVDIAALKVPNGWTADAKVWPGGSVIAFVAPAEMGGTVTVDFERRIFDGGYGRPGQLNLPSKNKKYTGRGWQDEIVSDATNWLQSVMTA